MQSCVGPELCNWFDKQISFPFIENYTLLFVLLCPPVWKPEAVGQAPADISFQIENDDFNLE